MSKRKVIAMIPARIGSQRVKRKNLRLINGKPLLAYVTETCKKAGCFDEIYINSEADIIGEFAKENGVKFYKRPAEFAGDTSTNDDFGLDFVNNVQGDVLIQLLPTSPFLTVEDIRKFTNEMLEKNYDSLISVEHKQIACLYKGETLNFEKTKPNPPSQTMTPVAAYATALMGWTFESFKRNMKKFGSAYHGGDGNTGYFELRGLSTIDIDREEDFQLASAILSGLDKVKSEEPKFWGDDAKKTTRTEVDVPSILKKDGVHKNDLADANREIVNIQDIYKANGFEHSWSKRVVNTENNSATIICQMPGEGNRLHFHPDWNEWWYILEGEWTWTIEGEEKKIKKGDFVFMPKGRVHKITAAGTGPAIRIAVSREDVAHVYPEDH